MPDLFRIRTDNQFVQRRPIPIEHLNITATSSGAAQTLFTLNQFVLFEVKHLAVVNVTASVATLSMHSIDDGGSIATGNAELVDYSVAPKSAVNLTCLIKQMYFNGQSLRVWSDTNGALVIHGHGDEIFAS